MTWGFAEFTSVKKILYFYPTFVFVVDLWCLKLKIMLALIAKNWNIKGYTIGLEYDEWWVMSYYLCRAQVRSLPQIRLHSCSISIQQSWVHLCRPQDLFFWHLFSHLASSGLPVNSQHGISLSIYPHLHLTRVFLGHVGQGPRIIINNTIA